MADYSAVSQALQGVGKTISDIAEQSVRRTLAEAEIKRAESTFELQKAQTTGQMDIQAKTLGLQASRESNEFSLKVAEQKRKAFDDEFVPVRDIVEKSSMTEAQKALIRPQLEQVDPTTKMKIGDHLTQRGTWKKTYDDIIGRMATWNLEEEKAKRDAAEKTKDRNLTTSEGAANRGAQMSIQQMQEGGANARNAATVAASMRNIDVSEAGANLRNAATVAASSGKLQLGRFRNVAVNDPKGFGTHVEVTDTATGLTYKANDPKLIALMQKAEETPVAKPAAAAPPTKAPNSAQQQVALFDDLVAKKDWNRARSLIAGMTAQGLKDAAAKYPQYAHLFKK